MFVIDILDYFCYWKSQPYPNPQSGSSTVHDAYGVAMTRLSGTKSVVIIISSRVVLCS